MGLSTYLYLGPPNWTEIDECPILARVVSPVISSSKSIGLCAPQPSLTCFGVGLADG